MKNIVDTLEEIKKYCKERKNCYHCFFRKDDDGYCLFWGVTPCKWETDKMTQKKGDYYGK